MKILEYNEYLDGGSIELITDEGKFCYDFRLKTKTEGKLYKDYPEDDNSNLIENSEELEKEIIENLKNYKNIFYQSSIDNLVKSKEKYIAG